MKQFLSACIISVALSLSATPEWLGNTLGLEHEVPTPFENVRISGKTVNVWGKIFIFNDMAFPEQVISLKQEMLTEEPVLFYEIDKNEETVLKPVSGAYKIQEQYPDYVVICGKAAAKDVKVDIRTELWFDGFMRITLKTDGGNSFKVKRFSIRYPFRPDVVGPHYSRPFMGYAPDLIRATWGQVKKKQNFPFMNYFNISGHDVSFTFLAECPYEWYLQRRSQAIQLEPSEDSLLFRVNFIDVFGKTILGKRTLDFGMLWGPSRPPCKDFRKYQTLWWEAQPRYVAEKAKLGLKPMVLLWPFSITGKAYAARANTPYGRASRVSFNVPEPENPGHFREWMKETQDAGGLVCPYINTDNFDPTKGAGKEYLKEWAGKPIPATFQKSDSGFAPRDGFYVCQRSSTWADYYVYTLVRLMKEYGFDGYYIDNCACHACENPNHGSECKPYLDESGRAWSRKPIFEARSIYLRIFRAVKKIKPDAVFFVNGGSYYPFWDFTSTAEYLTRIAGDEQLWPEFMERKDMEGGFFRGQQYGPLKLVYPAYRGRNINPKATRAMMSVLFAGDPVFWHSLCNTTPIDTFDQIRSKFKIWDAEFLPYWKNKKYVATSIPDIELTLYRKPNDALLIVANPWRKEAQTAVVSVMANQIFPGYNGRIKAVDAENQTVLEQTSGMYFENRTDILTVPVNGMDYKLILITKEEL